MAMNKPPYNVPLMSAINRLPWNGKKVVSTFSGCGGSSTGYKMAGFKVVYANEFIPSAQDTYAKNHPTTFLDRRDIREVEAQDILQQTGIDKGELDLFDGSPPCKDFSLAGNRDWESGKEKKYSDTKQRTDDLFDHYIRLLDGLQPKTFVAENVAGMTVGKAVEFLGEFQRDMFKDQTNTVLTKMMDCGYVVNYQVLNASKLGVPQERRRIIFVGVRKDIAHKHAFVPVFPRALPYTYSIRDAIPWLRDGLHSSIEEETDIARYAIGAEWDKLGIGEQSEKYFQLIKVNPDEPCPTICAAHGGNSIASTAHPYFKRKWSILELKRICGFPDDFALEGTFVQKWERLGRAVPPVMMSHIAATIRREILSKI